MGKREGQTRDLKSRLGALPDGSLSWSGAFVFNHWEQPVLAFCIGAYGYSKYNLFNSATGNDFFLQTALLAKIILGSLCVVHISRGRYPKVSITLAPNTVSALLYLYHSASQIFHFWGLPILGLSFPDPPGQFAKSHCSRPNLVCPLLHCVPPNQLLTRS